MASDNTLALWGVAIAHGDDAMTISVTNNPNGTFTVSCGTEVVVVGTPVQSSSSPNPPTQGAGLPGLPPLSGPGGFGTAQIIDSPRPPAEARPVGNVEQLLDMLRAARTSLPPGGPGQTSPYVVHFKMRGTHTLDVGKLAEVATGEAPNLAVRIHMVR